MNSLKCSLFGVALVMATILVVLGTTQVITLGSFVFFALMLCLSLSMVMVIINGSQPPMTVAAMLRNEAR